MSEKHNVCDIVLELLPYYIEQKTCEESNAYIEKHLEICKDCDEVYRMMKEDIPLQIDAGELGRDKKKSKRKRFARIIRKILLVILGIVGYIFLMIGIIVCELLYLGGF